MKLRHENATPRPYAAAAALLLCLGPFGAAHEVAPTQPRPNPLTTLMEYAIEVDQPFAQFGVAVRAAGDVNGDGYGDVLAAANGFDNESRVDGRVFVYHGSPLGISPKADWSAEWAQCPSMFDRSIAPAGDVNGDGYDDVLVGVPTFNNSAGNEGCARLYYGSPSGLASDAVWTFVGSQPNAQVAASVSGAGDVNGDGYDDVVVGVPHYSNEQADEGGALVFHGSPKGLSSLPDATLESNRPATCFGYAVSEAGDVNGDGYDDVIVGANGYAPKANDANCAVLYFGSPSGLDPVPGWQAVAYDAGSGFGAAVSAAGDINGDGYDDIVVGARHARVKEDGEGRAFVYHGSPSGPGPAPDWQGQGNQVRAEFGRSVSGAGDVNNDGYDDVIVGAFDYDGDEVDEGRTLVYLGSPSGLSKSPNWRRDGGQAEAYLGCSVAGAGDINGDGYDEVITGAYRYDEGQKNEGRAFLFYGSPRGPGWRPHWQAESDQHDANLGVSVASAGDVNGDGYDDVVVGAPAYDNDAVSDGRVFVHHGGSAGPSPKPSWEHNGPQSEAAYAVSLSTAGDVNGDGYDDVLIGAPGYGQKDKQCGRAFAYLGSADGLHRAAHWQADGNGAHHGSQFGSPVACAGDVNGDGYDDVVVGACKYSNGQADEGRAFLYHGSASGLSPEPDWTAESDRKDTFFGGSAAGAGDVNGDGFDDVVLGAHRYDKQFKDEGAAFLFLGSSSGLGSTPSWTAFGGQSNAWFGISVAPAGDVNGDGFDDVAVGASHYDNGENDEGAVFLFLGSAAGLSPTPAWTAEGNEIYAYFGYSIAAAGDVNHDGFDDVIVGTKGADAYQKADVGRAFLYCGSASGLCKRPQWMAIGPHEGSLFGHPVASAGDVNGDGFSDLLVGAERFTNGEWNEGGAFVFYMGPATLQPTEDTTAPAEDTSASPKP